MKSSFHFCSVLFVFYEGIVTVWVTLLSAKVGERLSHAMQKPSLVAFEACASAHHWARTAQVHGHEVRLLPAISVAPFRQGHKTDQNDALAVAEAARRPNLKEAPLKSLEQQGLVSVKGKTIVVFGTR